MSHPDYREEDDPDWDWGAAAQRAAEDHLLQVQTAFWGEQEGEVVPSPAFAPFDGCTTCEVREILNAAFPIIKRGLRREILAEMAKPPVASSGVLIVTVKPQKEIEG